MGIVKNDKGQKLEVSEGVYKWLRTMYELGCDEIIISVNEKSEIIPLIKNFNP